MRVVADSNAIVWYLANDPDLTGQAAMVLEEAEATDGICVPSIAVVDLWYASQKKGPSRVSLQDFARVKEVLLDEQTNFHVLEFGPEALPYVELVPKAELADPFDRMIIATALAYDLQLVTADGQIAKTGVIDVIW